MKNKKDIGAFGRIVRGLGSAKAITAFSLVVGVGGAGYFAGQGKFERALTVFSAGLTGLFGATVRRRGETIEAQEGTIQRLRLERGSNTNVARELLHTRKTVGALREALAEARGTNAVYSSVVSDLRQRQTDDALTIRNLGNTMERQAAKVREQYADLREIVGEEDEREANEAAETEAKAASFPSIYTKYGKVPN